MIKPASAGTTRSARSGHDGVATLEQPAPRPAGTPRGSRDRADFLHSLQRLDLDMIAEAPISLSQVRPRRLIALTSEPPNMLMHLSACSLSARPCRALAARTVAGEQRVRQAVYFMASSGMPTHKADASAGEPSMGE